LVLITANTHMLADERELDHAGMLTDVRVRTRDL